MSSIAIEKEISNTGGRDVARIDGREGEAELTFTVLDRRSSARTIPMRLNSLRGTGAAKALVEYMIADARKSGFKIIANCPMCAPRSKNIPTGAMWPRSTDLYFRRRKPAARAPPSGSAVFRLGPAGAVQRDQKPSFPLASVATGRPSR